MKKPPPEIVASLLAVSTILMSLPPLGLPGWATFIGWAGTFAIGDPTRDNMIKIWRTMPIGSVVAYLIVLGFDQASYFVSGVSYVLAQMVILFVLNTVMLSIARFQPLSFAPGMFFGFASYFAMYYGGFGPTPQMRWFRCSLSSP